MTAKTAHDKAFSGHVDQGGMFKCSMDDSPLGRDPLRHVLRNGMIRDIAIAMRDGSGRAAMILTFCGIDAMTHLSLPPGRDRATRKDFKAWVETYMSIVHDGHMTADEIYSARNGLVHAYTAESDDTRAGKVAMVGYVSNHEKPVLFHEGERDQFVLVNMEYLINDFARACDEFLKEVGADPARGPLLRQRLATLMIAVPAEEE